jgi:hypothetical protein
MITSPPISADQVAAQLAVAGATLRALTVPSCNPGGYRTAWPGFRLDPEGEPPAGGERDRAPQPTPAAISAMDRVLIWPQLIPAGRVRERRAVLARADGRSWRRIGVELGLSHEGARKVHHAGVTRIAAALNRQPGRGT